MITDLRARLRGDRQAIVTSPAGRRVLARLRGDRGSVLPLILGCWLLVMVVAAGYVAATDAFAQRVDLQDVCDAAAIAAANSIDFAQQRGAADGGEFLQLGDVQTAVDAYLARDPWRSAVEPVATLSADHTQVTLTCRRRSTIAFGWLFGKPSGIVITVSSSARAAVQG